MYAIFAVELGVKFLLSTNSLSVEEDGRTLRARLKVSEMFDHDVEHCLLVNLWHAFPAISLGTHSFLESS